MTSGSQLIGDIYKARVGPGELAFWWLGQHSFVVKLGDAILYLDPFLSPLAGRTVPPLLAPHEVVNATLIFGSHDHADHIDRDVWPALAQASPRAKFVVPDLLLTNLAEALNIPAARFIGMDDQKTVTVGGVRITGVAAAHEFLDRDPATGRHPYLGFVIEANGCRVYHAGDTCKYEGLETALKRWLPFDVAFLPINGRDARRLRANCIGNMTYQEAVDLAGAIKPRLAVAAHFEMFKQNSEDPRNFQEYMNVKYPHLRPHIPVHGQRFVLSPE